MVEKRQTKIEKIVGNAFRSAFRTERKRARAPKVEPHASAKPLSKEEKEGLNKQLDKALTLGDVKRLLDAGADVNAQDSGGYTPLMGAFLRPYPGVVDLLLERGADVTITSKKGHTALRYALYMGQYDGRIEHIKQLLERGADVDAKTQDGETPFTFVRELYNKELLKKRRSAKTRELYMVILQAKADKIAKKAADSLYTGEVSNEEKKILNIALAEAAYSGNVARAVAFLKAGADVDARDDSGETPLIRASAQGHLEVAKLLIRRGADVNARDGRERDKTVLMTAALMRQPEIAKLLIDSGADVHARDKGRHTAIWNAIYNREIRTIELLLDKGADVNARDKGGGTPLHWAAFHPRKEVIELLLQRGADVHAVDNDGETPLFSAATGMGLQYRAGIIELLAKNGAHLDHYNKYGNTPLWRAARKLYAEPTEALLKLGADASRVARHFAKTERILKSKDPVEDDSFMSLARVMNDPIIQHLKKYGALKQNE